MAKKRQYNTVRTDYLEQQLAHYRARRDYGAFDALESLARDVGAPIDREWIEDTAAKRKALYDHWAHGGGTMDDLSECIICNS